MRKYAYLARLEELLAALPAQERQEALNYYEEYFDAAGNENEEKRRRSWGIPLTWPAIFWRGRASKFRPRKQLLPPLWKLRRFIVACTPPEPAVAAPAGPEPPPLEDPDSYPTKGIASHTKGAKPYAKRLWLVFWLLVALALVVQVSVLLLGLGGRGGNSAYETAASTAVSYQEDTVAMSEAASVQQDVGKLIYSSTLDTPGKGTLFVNLSCGNVAFKTGDQAEIEVSGSDHNSTVSYGETVDYGYTLSCDNADLMPM